MTEYISGVLVTVAVICLAGLVSYNGKTDGATKCAFAILLLYVVALPLGDLIKNFDASDIFEDIEIDESLSEEEYTAVAREALCDGVRRMICEKFDTNEEDVHVSAINFDFKNMTAERLKIVLRGNAAMKDHKAIRAFISECGDWECEIEIEIG